MCYSLHVYGNGELFLNVSYSLVRNRKEFSAIHWKNQLIAWTLPLLTTLVLFVFDCLATEPFGDCGRVWYRIRYT